MTSLTRPALARVLLDSGLQRYQSEAQLLRDTIDVGTRKRLSATARGEIKSNRFSWDALLQIADRLGLEVTFDVRRKDAGGSA